MKKASLFISVFILFASTLLAAESHYEVYYFHASWRCANCTNAEAWTGEAVELLRKSNPNVEIVYSPKQLETEKDLVAATKAKRVVLVVAEVRDGKMIRHENIGNLLNVVASKQLLMKTVLDGIVEFGGQSMGAGTLRQTDEYAVIEKKANAPVRKIGIFLIINDAETNQEPRLAEVIIESLNNDFAEQIQKDDFVFNLVDADNSQNKGFLDMFEAKGGDVVVALLSQTGMESFDTVKGPDSEEQDKVFLAEFTKAVRGNIDKGDL